MSAQLWSTVDRREKTLKISKTGFENSKSFEADVHLNPFMSHRVEEAFDGAQEAIVTRKYLTDEYNPSKTQKFGPTMCLKDEVGPF